MTFVSFQQWAEDFSVLLTNETFKLIDSKNKSNGPEAGRYVATTYLARFVGTLLFRTLTERNQLNTTKEEQEDFVMKNAAELKTAIQEAVSMGFQSAMTQFSGRQIEYYCQIKPVPEPVSNKVN